MGEAVKSIAAVVVLVVIWVGGSFAAALLPVPAQIVAAKNLSYFGGLILGLTGFATYIWLASAKITNETGLTPRERRRLSHTVDEIQTNLIAKIAVFVLTSVAAWIVEYLYPKPVGFVIFAGLVMVNVFLFLMLFQQYRHLERFKKAMNDRAFRNQRQNESIKRLD